MEENKELRMVVVGDERCGKSSLISRFINNGIPSVYKPTSFDKHITRKEVGGELFNIIVWDTSGSNNFDTVRPLSYGEADVFIVCFKISDPVSLLNVKSRWMEEISSHSRAPIILCGCMTDQRNDESVVTHLSRLGRSPVSSDQAMAIASQVGASHYVETAAAVSYAETFQLFSMAAMAAIDFRRLQCPAPSYHVSTGSATSLTRAPSSPLNTTDYIQPVHTRSASQPVRSPVTPRSPPLPPRNIDNTDLRTRTPLTRNSSIRASMPVGKPPLPSLPATDHRQPLPTPSLPKSPSDLLHLSPNQPGVTTEPVPGSKSRLARLGVPEHGKNYESLKSYSSTASHGSTGSKMSSASSQMSAQWTGPRDANLPDTEDPNVLSNLQFISPKAGVYRPIHSGQSRAATKKDKCSVM